MIYRKKDRDVLKERAKKLYKEDRMLASEIAKLVQRNDLKNDIEDQLNNCSDLPDDIEITSDMVEVICKIASKEIYNLETDERYYQCIDNAIDAYINAMNNRI